MDVTIKGKGHVSLNKADFLASGGEGQIFRKGAVAYKVYSDQSKMLSPDKIRELSVLTLPNIIRPQDIILDGHHRPIGYTMPFVKDAYALCQMFPRAFRDRMGLKPPVVLDLVRKLQEIVEHCHSRGILVVDLNEMNFMVDDGFDQVYAIDCDSYQTPSFPATAIMENIRDRHAKKFDAGTDWFSFGIVSFQMFIGIHPYRGKHPKLKTLDERMEQNVSVLNDAVSIPAVCYPFSNIPKPWLEWYKAVFEKGQRLAPPSGVQQVVIAVVAKVKVPGSNNFVTKKIMVLPEDVIRFDAATRHAVTNQGVYFDSKLEFDSNGISKPPLLAMTPAGRTIAAWLQGGKLRMYNISQGQDVQIDIAAEKAMACDGRICVKNADKLLEILFVETASGIAFVSPVELCKVLPNATQLYDGVAFQDVLGSCHAAISPKSKHCYQPRIKELDGHRICDARFDRGVLVAISYHGGQYRRTTIRFDEDFLSYDIYRIDNDVGAQAGINFVTLPTGVVVMVDNEKEEMEIFSAAKGSTKAKVFSDPVLDDIRLFRDGAQVLFCKGDELYSIKVK
jgi:hypothetical protein